MQGQPPNCCFLIYLYSPGSPVLINYHLQSALQGETFKWESGGKRHRDSVKIFRLEGLVLAMTLLHRVNEWEHSALCKAASDMPLAVSQGPAEGVPGGAWDKSLHLGHSFWGSGFINTHFFLLILEGLTLKLPKSPLKWFRKWAQWFLTLSFTYQNTFFF